MCELPYENLQPVVLLMQLQSPLVGELYAPPGLVSALPHGNIVPLPPQSILHGVLGQALLLQGASQGPGGRGRRKGEKSCRTGRRDVEGLEGRDNFEI